MSPELQKLSIKEKVGYSLGDTASNLFFLTFLIYMPKFYTDVFGLSASAVAVMFLVSKIWDAVNDPMMGMIADRTHTRWGKYRPYLLWFAIPLGVAGILTFSTPNLAGNGKLIYAYVTYTSLMMLYTVVNVPYSSLMGVMTASNTDRTSISSFRFVAAFVGQFTAQYAVGILVMKLGGGNDARGYRLTMTMLSGLAVVLLFITFATTRERVQPARMQRIPLGRDLKDLFTNKPWVLIGVATFFQLFFISIMSGIVPYYFEYFVQDQEVTIFGKTHSLGFKYLETSFLLSGTAATIVGAVLTKWISGVIGKARSYYGFLGLGAAATAGFYFLEPNQLVFVFALHLIRGFSLGPVSVLQWAMYTDTADYSEWKTGRRATGLIMSASLFSLKLGLALGASALTGMLAHYGYEANQAQTDAALRGIRLLMSLIPAAFALVGVFVMFFYPLNNTRMAEIETELVRRRKEAQNDQAPRQGM